jgi:hypothetical protein
VVLGDVAVVHGGPNEVGEHRLDVVLIARSPALYERDPALTMITRR